MSAPELPPLIPTRVHLSQGVRGDFPFTSVWAPPGDYPCEANRWGAVSIKASNGKMLGLRPSEFEVLEWGPNPAMRTARVVHVSLSVRGALLWKDSQLRGLFKIADKGGFLDPREAREHLMDCLAEGQEFLPMGPCEGFDPKNGCPGHPTTHEGA